MNFYLEIIGANQKIDKDWSEFESYATSLYAKSLVTNQTFSKITMQSSKVQQEQQTFSNTHNEYSQNQLDINQLNIKTITEEMVSIKKVLQDLCTCSEEVRQ